MRAVLCVSIALLLSLGNAQTVSLQSSGTSLAKVISTVAQQTGKKLAVDKQLAGEIVVVSVHDVELETFEKQLADCVSGKWVEIDGGIRELRVDSKLCSERRAKAQQEMAAAVPARIKESREMYQRSFNAGREGTWANASQTLLDILGTLPQATFEDVLPMSSTVLSTIPNAAQRKLNDPTEIVRKYFPTQEIKEVKVSISRASHSPYLNSAIWIVEMNGNFHQSTIGLVTIAKPEEKQPGKAIAWSPVSLELGRNYRTWGYLAETGLLVLSQELRDVLSKPTQVDPISFGFGEGFLAVAAERKTNLIATAADDDIIGALSYGVAGTTTGDFLSSIKRNSSLVTSENDGWLLIRPKDPIVARELRGDRAALEKLIAKAKGATTVSLDDLVEFASSNIKCAHIPSAFLLPFQTLVNYYGAIDTQYVSGDLRPLQFYGTLGTSQRARLRNGEQLAVSQIPPKAKEVLEMIFYQPAKSFPGSLRVEPTSALPRGITADLGLLANVSESPLIYPLPDAGEATIPSRAKSLQKLAQEKWSRKYDDNPYSREIPELTRFLVGDRTLWDIHVIEGNQIYATMQVADDRIPPTAKPTMLEQASERLRAQMDRAYEEYLKAMGGG